MLPKLEMSLKQKVGRHTSNQREVCEVAGSGCLIKEKWITLAGKKKKIHSRFNILRGKSIRCGLRHRHRTGGCAGRLFWAALTSRFWRQYQQNVCLQFLHIIWAQPSLRSIYTRHTGHCLMGASASVPKRGLEKKNYRVRIKNAEWFIYFFLI